MRPLYLFFLLLVPSLSIYAQSPRTFNYQAVARNATGQPYPNQLISVVFSILDSAGSTLFTETHQPTTNSYGLFTLGIGKGNAELGVFADLDWTGEEKKYLSVQFDPTGGSNYILVGMSELESVPFSLYAQKSGSAPPVGNASGDLGGTYPHPTVAALQGQAVSADTPATGNILRWDGNQWGPSVDSSGWVFSGTTIHNANNGFVGVGTASPMAPLHIHNPTVSTEGIRLSGTKTWLSFWDGAFYDGFIWNNSGNIALGTSHLNSGGNLRLYTYGQERLTIKPGGFVGIGTTTPSYKLHVEDAGVAIYGKSASSFGLYGYGSGQIGIYGYSNAQGSAGIFGQSAYIGVEGITNAGSTDGNRQGVRGDNGGSASGWAGYFFGKVGVSGTLTKGAGSFKIDHPLDPEHKYLYHSFVESPDMKNIYDGLVTTDAQGMAVVTLPDWFEALNEDFRYQLTVIGTFAQAIISQRINHNTFTIQTDKPQIEVSWQVTGIRKDPYAAQNRIPVEEDKPADKVGKYLHPQAYGKSIEQAVDYLPRLQPIKQ